MSGEGSRLTGLIVFLYGYGSGAYIAFTEDGLYGWLYLIFPPYAAYYFVSRWDDMSSRLVMLIVGLAMLTGGGRLLEGIRPADAGRRKRSRRRRDGHCGRDRTWPEADLIRRTLTPALSCSEIWFVCTRTISRFTGDIARRQGLPRGEGVSLARSHRLAQVVAAD